MDIDDLRSELEYFTMNISMIDLPYHFVADALTRVQLLSTSLEMTHIA